MGFGGFLGSSAAGKAAKAMKGAIKYQKQIYKDTKGNITPFIEGGTAAFTDLSSNDFRNREWYDFQRDELNRTVDRGLSLRGNFFSGAGMEAEDRANIALTGQQVEAEKNLLLQLSQLGSQSALGLGQIGAGTGASVANATANQGQFQLSRGQLLGQGIDSTLGAVAGGVSGYANYSLADRYLTGKGY